MGMRRKKQKEKLLGDVSICTSTGFFHCFLSNDPLNYFAILEPLLNIPDTNDFPLRIEAECASCTFVGLETIEVITNGGPFGTNSSNRLQKHSRCIVREDGKTHVLLRIPVELPELLCERSRTLRSGLLSEERGNIEHAHSLDCFTGNGGQVVTVCNILAHHRLLKALLAHLLCHGTKNSIGLCVGNEHIKLHIFQTCNETAEIFHSRLRELIEHHFSPLRKSCLNGIADTHAVIRVLCHDCHFGVPLLSEVLRNINALQSIAGIRTEDEITGIGNIGAAAHRGNLHDARGLGNGSCTERLAAALPANDGNDLVDIDEFPRGIRGITPCATTIFCNELHLAATDASGCIHFLHLHLHGIERIYSVRRCITGERPDVPDLHRFFLEHLTCCKKHCKTC